MLKAKILNKGNPSENEVLVLGFVGEGVGVIRGVCVDPVTGVAKGYPLHELIFQPQVKMTPEEETALNDLASRQDEGDEATERYGRQPNLDQEQADKADLRPPWRRGQQKS